jgi:hypothetical protein
VKLSLYNVAAEAGAAQMHSAPMQIAEQSRFKVISSTPHGANKNATSFAQKILCESLPSGSSSIRQ